MATVYERICEYEKTNRFRFTAQGKKNVGSHTHRAWLESGNEGTLPYVESIEPAGTFQVLNYPDHFTENIDEIIRWYVNRAYQLYLKKISEKPRQATPQILASEPQKKRPRKRIPIPAYTGSYKK